ncbi:MAG: energy transducer TonB [Spirochaetaceae bacterium]|jgi:protein TonB|nr:energy transducer TonB [Spirochaetaceae bacterium]
MTSDKKINITVLGISIAVHLAVLFLVVFKTAAKEPPSADAVPISIVDISEHKSTRPAAVPRVREPPKEAPPVEDEIAETVVETEEETAAAGESSVDIDAAQYVKDNYTYVQRRILQELIYPSKARRTGVQGVVEVVFTINSNGSAVDIEVRKSSGKPILDEEALRAVQSASPYRRPKNPVRIIIPVSFKLT